MLFEVNTLENLDTDVEGYKFYKNLTVERVKKLVDKLLKEMVDGRVSCFNVSVQTT